MAAIGYLLITLLVFIFQELLIFPAHAVQGNADRILRSSPDSSVVPLKTALGDQIYLLFGQAMNENGSLRSDPQACPTILFFYGNGNTLSDMTELCRGWRKMGANVAGVEYPGYGMSSGLPSENGCYASADAAYDYLLTRSDIDRNKFIAIGQSLGTGVAIDLAVRKPIAAVGLVSPYTSMAEMARITAPFLPTGLMLKHHFRSEEKIRLLKVPVLIAHGTHDHTIPVSMAHRLAAAAIHAKVTTVFVDSDHNDIFDRTKIELDAAISALINQVKDRP